MNGGKSKMRSESIDEAVLVKYLLGNLSESDQAKVEDRVFADADYLAALEASEADLIDTYVRGGLSQPDRRAFEQRFLTSPNRRSRVEFARALARVAAESTEHQPQAAQRTFSSLIHGWSPALRFASAFAAVICIAGASWLIFQNAAMRSRMGIFESQRRDLETREQELRRQLAEEQSRVQRQQPSANRVPAVVALMLVPGISRSETRVEQLVLPPSAQIAQIAIQLEARDYYPRYRAELRTRRGEDVLTQGNLPRRRTGTRYAVAFDVPTSALASGEYELSLKGIAGDGAAVDIGYYYFSVRKQ